DPRPRPLAVALAVFGIAAWLAGAAWLVRRGAAGSANTVASATGSPARRLLRHPALAPAALTLVGLAAWALGLYTA
ncbi:MAG TPA: hypothetical protein VK932_02120, partial [Kofleriaceae bacterium]|nr:hypothetical protein [Kofleriaceae bacterium]